MKTIDGFKDKIICGDCLDVMKEIPDRSIDMILCDLPYGVTQNREDKTLDLTLLWTQYLRIIKDKGIIVLTSQFPYTLDLINGNRRYFRYDLIWDKHLTSGFLNSNRMPLRKHEHLLVFYKRLGKYNPQFMAGKPLHSKGISYMDKEHKNNNYGHFDMVDDSRAGSTSKYPVSIISIPKSHPSKALHPTEKPVRLAEYLISTYTDVGDIVLDNCIGTGWTAVACKHLSRHFIGIDISRAYCDMSEQRLMDS
ncbi:site-specific DNA-methyltransferase [archaeon]|nr:site-specific DNA-methyltransferase [archaeon]